MKAVREAFEAARLDAPRIDEALDATEAFLAADPAHPVALAYLGGLQAMKAGAAVLPWVKMRHANAAIALLDRAHERRFEVLRRGEADDRPADLEILLVRGIAYANFPSFLAKSETARQCLEAARAHPAFASVPTRYRALTYAHLAVLCHRERESESARGHLEHAIAADAHTADIIWAAR